MKPKLNIHTVVLCLTGILFIAGLFYVSRTTRQQIRSANSDFSTFEEQLQDQKSSLESAKSTFADAIQSEKDILNWRAHKADGISSAVHEADPDPNASSDTKPSIFSQNTAPEYNDFSDENADSDSNNMWSDSDDTPENYDSDQPVA